jgi:NADH:ubiquinone oxidoreductase subunit 2 (subunit N)
MEKSAIELVNYAPQGIFLMLTLFVVALKRDVVKYSVLYTSVITSACYLYFYAKYSGFEGVYSRLNVTTNLVFYITFFISVIFSQVKKMRTSLLPFYALIGFAGFTIINTDNVFVAVISLEIAFISTVFLAFRNNRSFKDVYSYFVFGVFSTALLLNGIAILYIDAATSSISKMVSGEFHPALYLVILGIFFKIGLFPLHRKLFNIFESETYCTTAVHFIFWIPAVLYTILNNFIVPSVFKANFIYPLILLFVIVLNLIAYVARKEKKSIPFVLLAAFASILLLNGYAGAHNLFIKSYVNYAFVLFGALLVLSRDKEVDELEINNLDLLLYVLLVIGGLGMSFTWSFWVNLEIYTYLFSVGLPLILVVLFLNSLLGLYNATSNSRSIIKIDQNPKQYVTGLSVVLAGISLMIVFAALFSDRIDSVLEFIIAG